MRMSVIGLGYLGTAHAVAMAELGHEIVGVDVDQAKIERLQAGEAPFYEPRLPELLMKHVVGGRLRFTTNLRAGVENTHLHFVCVGTPQQAGKYSADLSFVDAAFRSLADNIEAGSVVVGKSTVPPGTVGRLARLIDASGGLLVWNPEFLREGFAIADTLEPSRIVLGVDGGAALTMMHEAYGSILSRGTPLIITDYSTAELAKISANAFLATKISFINAMAEICEVTGGDVVKLAEAIGYDPRIGHRCLHAGLGFGGGCLPKDIRAFMVRAGELGVDQALTFLKNIDEINLRRRTRVVDLARELCKDSFAGVRVGVLGAAFKPNSDDIRDSPALDVAVTIQKAGAAVRVYDPQAMANAKNGYPTLAYADSPHEACRDADIVLHLTEWEEFRNLEPEQFGRVVRHRNIVDGRNSLDTERWRAAGWTFRALGRPRA